MKNECIRCVTPSSENVVTLALRPGDQDLKPKQLRKNKTTHLPFSVTRDDAYKLADVVVS